MIYFDMSNFDDTDKSKNVSIGSTLKEAQDFIDAQPYWCAAIEKRGMVRTICNEYGEPVSQRTYRITLSRGKVERSAWSEVY